jgi:ubiquinone/menaquinone biosynthesis C-methylase UbiE
MAHPERIDPSETESGILAIHLKRYDFGRRFSKGADVLDAACGLGYGTAYLAEVARRVRGVDASTEAIAIAERRYPGPNVMFGVADVQALPDSDASYDVVVSFETIEHVDQPTTMLGEIARVLRDDGTFIVSTPKARVTTSTPTNPHHRTEWSTDDFARLLQACFAEVDLYGQRRVQTSAHRVAQRLDVFGLRRRLAFLRGGARILGTTPTAELTLDDIVIEPGVGEHATEIVAVCRGPRR